MRLPGGPARGGQGDIREARLRARCEIRPGVLPGHASGPRGEALVGDPPRRRHVRVGSDRDGLSVPGPGRRRLPDRGRLRLSRSVPRGDRRLPSRARDHGADRAGRLECRQVAAPGRGADLGPGAGHDHGAGAPRGPPGVASAAHPGADDRGGRAERGAGAASSAAERRGGGARAAGVLPGRGDVGVVGCVGAIGVRNIAWWEGSVTWGSFIHRYQELGGGDLPAFAWDNAKLPPTSRLGAVDTVDGFVMGLSPWVVRNIRFDESLGRLHGYDFDFCLQVREAGKRVVTADFKAIHHHSLDLVSNPDGWLEAHMRIAEQWDGRMPNVGAAGGDWKLRARRSEADAAVNQALAVSNSLKGDARVLELRRELDEMKTSVSWRLTHPLRRLNYWRKRLLVREDGADLLTREGRDAPLA